MNNNNQNLIPQNTPYCPEHGQCQEKQNTHEIRLNDHETRLRKLEENDIKLQMELKEISKGQVKLENLIYEMDKDHSKKLDDFTKRNEDITKTILEAFTNKINKDTETENKIKLTDRKEFWAVIVAITGVLTSVVTYFIK